MNYINLIDLIQGMHFKDLEEKYVNKLCSFSKRQYKPQELEAINDLVSNLNLDYKSYDGFIYSYIIPHIGKEFDLIKTTKNAIINIELKTKQVSDKVLKQLKKNRYYLNMLGLKIYQFTYLSEEKKLLYFDNNKLVESNFNFLKTFFSQKYKPTYLNLDEIFTPKNILISPISDPLKFLNNEYFLTSNQEQIKARLMKNKDSNFIGIKGQAGTGKTLLLYDIAKEISKYNKVLIIHCNVSINERLKMENVDIINIDDFNTSLKYDYILIDEAQRINDTYYDLLIKYIDKYNKKCIFTFDENQVFKLNDITIKLKELCKENIYTLTNKIRTNNIIYRFIESLFDLKNIKRIKSDYNKDINILYVKDYEKAILEAISLQRANYKFISLNEGDENSIYNYIGQDFLNVVIILDDNFYYEDKALKSKNEIYVKLLYQALTRAKEKLLLIITDIKLFEKIMQIYVLN